MKIKMQASDFSRLMKSCKPLITTGKDAIARPGLSRICFRVFCDESEVEGVSTNGYAIVQNYAPIVSWDGESNPGETHYDFLLSPCVAPKEADFVTIEDTEEVITITFFRDSYGEEKIVSSLTQTRMKELFLTQYQRIFKKSADQTLATTFDVALLRKFLEALKDEDNITIRLYGEYGPIMVDGRETRGLCLPVKLDDATAEQRNKATQEREAKAGWRFRK